MIESSKENDELINQELHSIFKTEILNRIDEIVRFNPLSNDLLVKIANKFIKILKTRLLKQGITLEFTNIAIDKIIEKNNEEEHIAHVEQLNKDEENELSELLKQIQKKDKINTPDSDETIKDFKLDLTVEDDSENVEDNESIEDSNLFVNIFLELISAILSSFCILFMGIAIAVLLMHQWGKGGFIGIIEIIYNIYNSIVTMCFSFIFNTLHNCIDFIPTYSNYINENPIFSNQGVNLLNIFIFNTGIIFITKVI
jgi:hypothetical protein